MTEVKDREPASGFNRRAFIGGAAGAAALPLVAKAAGNAGNAPVASDPSLPVDVTLQVNGVSISDLPAPRRAATTASVGLAPS
jgi:hypothetical protein